MTSKIEELPASSCNFCGKGKGDVYKIVVANSVGICDECIALCNKVLTDEKSKSGLKQLKQWLDKIKQKDIWQLV